MSRLFQSFSQIDSSTARKYGGSGLGLAISKRLAEMMNGKMWVESEAGMGSTFHFTIQVEPVISGPIDIAQPETLPVSDRQGHLDLSLSVLLAEDNLVNQIVTKKMLNKLGYRADVAANGRGGPAGSGGAGLRCHIYGCADAGDGRPGGDKRDTQALARLLPQNYRYDGLSAEGRSRDVSGCRDGRLHKQAHTNRSDKRGSGGTAAKGMAT